MRVLTAWFIRNSVAANLLMGFILFMGVITLITMRVEGFPRIESDRIAMVLIYVLLAVPLKSYWQPFIILAIVPFGFVGAILGHLYLDLDLDLALSLLSMFGMLALAGVVVNDSLVMLSRHNELVAEGMNPYEAIQAAATSRFRAIFLTTTTTVVGLLPLLLETSEQAQYLKPAAVSLAFGELFSTALMLLLVPVLIAITQDLKQLRLTAVSTKPPKESPCHLSL